MSFALPSLACSPGAPRPRVQPLQTGRIGPCPEEVEVAVRRRDRLVTHPGLHRARVDAVGQPQTRRRVAQVVHPPPQPRALPVHRPAAPPADTRSSHAKSSATARPGSLPSDSRATIGSTRFATRGTRRERRPFVLFVPTPSGADRRTVRPGVGTCMTSSAPGLPPTAARSILGPAGRRPGAGPPKTTVRALPPARSR